MVFTAIAPFHALLRCFPPELIPLNNAKSPSEEFVRWGERDDGRFLVSFLVPFLVLMLLPIGPLRSSNNSLHVKYGALLLCQISGDWLSVLSDYYVSGGIAATLWSGPQGVQSDSSVIPDFSARKSRASSLAVWGSQVYQGIYSLWSSHVFLAFPSVYVSITYYLYYH